MQFQWADSLFSCGRKADSCEKYAVTKISSLTTDVYPWFFRQIDSARTLGSRGYFFLIDTDGSWRDAERKISGALSSSVYFILGILRMDLWSRGRARAEREKKRKKPFPTLTPFAFGVKKSSAVFIIIRTLNDI